MRVKIKVKLEHGDIKEALTFVYPQKETCFRPSEEYLNIIVEGAQMNNLSLRYISEAFSSINE